MFTLLFYTCSCMIVAGILTIVSQLFRPIHRKGDSKPWYAMFFFFALVFVIPYAYTEGLTWMYGANMKSAIKDVYYSSEIDGPMRYFRIIGYRPDKEATALVVGLEREAWGGTDRPILSVHLVKEGDNWKADSYEIVCAERLNKDGYVLPPYW